MGNSGIADTYSKRAARYNITANLYYVMGVRVNGYRKRAVEALRLRPGDKVLDLACGTGANFTWLEQAVGQKGHILGLDLTPGMLREAQTRVQKNGWKNVELVQADVADFDFPAPIDGIICSYAISLMPNFEEIIQKSATVLREGGRIALLDVRYTGGKNRFLNAAVRFLTRAFGSSDEVLRRRPWEAMSKHFSKVEVTNLYLGFLYIAVGTKLSSSH